MTFCTLPLFPLCRAQAVMRIVVKSIVISTLLLPCGCATLSKQQLSYKPGVAVETLSAAASISISRGEQGMGSSGYLLYQRPDRMRLVILSPFGTTLMEAIVSGNRITIINNAKSEAYSGLLEDLPRIGQGGTFFHARWVMDTDPPGRYAGDGSLERVNSLGDSERVTFEKTVWSSPKPLLTAIWFAIGTIRW